MKFIAQNCLFLENLEKLATGTIEALARTVDAKSKWTAGHSERVAALGAKIGKILRQVKKLGKRLQLKL